MLGHIEHMVDTIGSTAEAVVRLVLVRKCTEALAGCGRQQKLPLIYGIDLTCGAPVSDT